MLLGAVLDVHVAVQFRVGEETLAAEFTRADVLFEVSSLVHRQLGRLDKSASAHVADKVPLPRVDPPVHCQGTRSLE